VKTAIRALLIVLSAGVLAGCKDSPTSPIVFVGPPNLVITDLQVGTGATVAVGQTVDVQYSLWLYDPTGTDFKGTSIESGRTTLRIATGAVIQGWVDGVPGMKVGGIRRLIIPPSLAYGSTGSGPIPPNAWTVFDIQLFGVTN